MEKEHEVFQFDQIDDLIWIGTNQCCTVHFDSDLLKKGIRADISLEEKRVDAPFGVNSYLWLPTADHESPSLDQLKLGVEHLKVLVSEKTKIYTHCKNGHGRAPTLVAAYYISTGLSVDDAIEKVMSKRRGAHINEAQKAGLEEFKKYLGGYEEKN